MSPLTPRYVDIFYRWPSFGVGPLPDIFGKAVLSSLKRAGLSAAISMIPERTSFFSMRAGVPHGECVAKASDRPPSYYVTKSEKNLNLPDNTTLVRPDWRSYSKR